MLSVVCTLAWPSCSCAIFTRPGPEPREQFGAVEPATVNQTVGEYDRLLFVD
jgi:hypothetical protein